jgi:hypothetical protein
MALELQSAALAPLVAQALNRSDLEILEWRVTSLGAQGSKSVDIGEGVWRISGTARDDEGVHSWSLIRKGLHASDVFNARDPTSWNYWKREALAYQSGLLTDLPRILKAPQCYAVQDDGDERVWLWLEDIQESVPTWRLADYGLAAHQLGEFNGAYLCGFPLPKAELWLSRGRVWSAAATLKSQLTQKDQLTQTPMGQYIFRGDSITRLSHLWQEAKPLLQAFERLPVCFCHHDAFRRNLIFRKTPEGMDETVAIDWAFLGFGRVGEEIGVTTAITIAFADLPASETPALHQAVFAGYVSGLRAAGWCGDVRQVRLGYLISAAIRMAVACLAFIRVVGTPEAFTPWEPTFRKPFDDFGEHVAQALPFFLNLGDEAVALAAAM